MLKLWTQLLNILLLSCSSSLRSFLLCCGGLIATNSLPSHARRVDAFLSQHWTSINNLRRALPLFHLYIHIRLLEKISLACHTMMLFHVQLFAIAMMFCPGLWVTPPRPPDTPPISRRAVVGYKVLGGFVLSQVAWFIPDGSRCQPDSLCDMLRAHDKSLARSALRLDHSPSPPPPLSRPYVSSLLKTTCPVVIIPPRPAPTCRNTDMHPTFEWAPRSLAPSPILAERSCSPSPIPIFLGDERTYVHPNISPFPLPRPTDAAPISRVLLIVVWLSGRKFLGRMCAAILVLATLVARRWRHRMEALCRVEGHDIFQALKNILWLASCGIIGRSYHLGDVNINLTLIASVVAGYLLCDMLTKGAVPPQVRPPLLFVIHLK
jgi:hypothetical protein